VAAVASGQVLIVSADPRWRRVLEVTLQLAGAGTSTGASLAEALRIPIGEDTAPTALVIDLSAQATPAELDDVRTQLGAAPWPAVVILPERLGAERERVGTATTKVLVRPYRPSELYAALWPTDPPRVQPGESDAPLSVTEPSPVTDAPAGDIPAPDGG
jgi:DNA-binding response OmpR family regulator